MRRGSSERPWEATSPRRLHKRLPRTSSRRRRDNRPDLSGSSRPPRLPVQADRSCPSLVRQRGGGNFNRRGSLPIRLEAAHQRRVFDEIRHGHRVHEARDFLVVYGDRRSRISVRWATRIRTPPEGRFPLPLQEPQSEWRMLRSPVNARPHPGAMARSSGPASRTPPGPNINGG